MLRPAGVYVPFRTISRQGVHVRTLYYTVVLVDLRRGIKSVYELLKEKGGLAVLNDANVEIATREVLANGRSRPQITKDIRRKVRRFSFDSPNACVSPRDSRRADSHAGVCKLLNRAT